MNKHKWYQLGLRDGACISSWSVFNQVPDAMQPGPCRGHGVSCGSARTGKAGLLVGSSGMYRWEHGMRVTVSDSSLPAKTNKVHKQDTFCKVTFLEQIWKSSHDFAKGVALWIRRQFPEFLLWKQKLAVMMGITFHHVWFPCYIIGCRCVWTPIKRIRLGITQVPNAKAGTRNKKRKAFAFSIWCNISPEYSCYLSYQ